VREYRGIRERQSSFRTSGSLSLFLSTDLSLYRIRERTQRDQRQRGSTQGPEIRRERERETDRQTESTEGSERERE